MLHRGERPLRRRPSPHPRRHRSRGFGCGLPGRFRYGEADNTDQIGQVTGLAWTEVGGDLLTIEAAVIAGKGKPLYTGQLGDVMQESISAAMTVVRTRAEILGIDPEFYQKFDFHIHHQ